MKFHLFCMPISQLKYLGPWRFEKNLGASPNVNAGGCENAAGLSQLLMDWFAGIGFTPGTTLGRWLKPKPTLFDAGWMEMGNPDSAVRMPVHCQPPRTASTGLLQPPPNVLPLPKGNS